MVLFPNITAGHGQFNETLFKI